MPFTAPTRPGMSVFNGGGSDASQRTDRTPRDRSTSAAKAQAVAPPFHVAAHQGCGDSRRSIRLMGALLLDDPAQCSIIAVATALLGVAEPLAANVADPDADRREVSAVSRKSARQPGTSTTKMISRLAWWWTLRLRMISSLCPENGSPQENP